jgi:WD40 repeat protein
VKPKIYLLLALFYLLICSFQPAATHAQEQLSDVQWSPFPNIISTNTRDEIVLLSPELEEIDRWQVTNETINELILYSAWSPDGSKLAVMLSDPLSSFAGFSVAIWDVATRQRIGQVKDIFPTFLEWSYNSHYVIVDSATKTRPHQNQVWFINSSNGEIRYRWNIITNSIALHPTMLQMATIGAGVQLWDVTVFPPMQLGQLPMAHDIPGIVYDASGTKIAYNPLKNDTDNEMIAVYSTQSLQIIQTLNIGKSVGRVSWGHSPLTTYVSDGLRIWNADTGQTMLHIPDFRIPMGDPAYLPSWNPDGTAFVYNDAELGITVRDGRTGEILARMDAAMPEMP